MLYKWVIMKWTAWKLERVYFLLLIKPNFQSRIPALSPWPLPHLPSRSLGFHQWGDRYLPPCQSARPTNLESARSFGRDLCLFATQFVKDLFRKKTKLYTNNVLLISHNAATVCVLIFDNGDWNSNRKKETSTGDPVYWGLNSITETHVSIEVLFIHVHNPDEKTWNSSEMYVFS